MMTAVEPVDGRAGKALDANRYATKKTVAQGMLDIALLTANASQLKYVLQIGKQHEFYTLMVTLISISIALQSLIFILSLAQSCINIKLPSQRLPAEIISSMVIGLALLSTVSDTLKMTFAWDPDVERNSTLLKVINSVIRTST